MGRLKLKYIALILMTVLIVIYLFSINYSNYLYDIISNSDKKTSYNDEPYFIGKLEIGNDNNEPHIGAIGVWKDELYVSYRNIPKIDIFNPKYKKHKSIIISNNRPVTITDIEIDSTTIYVADSLNKEIRLYDHFGDLKKSFKYYPDGKTKIGCNRIHLNSGILYVTDIYNNSLLAINVSYGKETSEFGEIIFNTNLNNRSSKPCAISTTIDGRIMVGNIINKNIDVYSCNGRYLYTFNVLDVNKMIYPSSIDNDQLISQKVAVEAHKSFITSNIVNQGRLHILDSKVARVNVFDPYGKFILSYGKELESPYDIKVEQGNRLIYISDLDDNSIKIFKY